MRQKGITFLPLVFVIALMGVVGYFFYTHLIPKETNIISDITSYTSSGIETEDWKKHTDSIYLFEVSVPNSWYIVPTGRDGVVPAVTFKAHNYNYNDQSLFDGNDTFPIPTEKLKNPFSLEIGIGTDNQQTLEEIASEPSAMTGEYPMTEPVTIDGKKAYKQVWPGSEDTLDVYIVINEKNWRYTLVFRAWEGHSTISENKEVLNQILSSFRLLD